MKVISIWQPFAQLIVTGCKVFETRTWPAPQSVIGQRIGIAATARVVPGQRAHWDDETFRLFYPGTGLPEPHELPMGALVGTAVLDSVELMTPELMEDVSREEQAYGWWDEGNYAWRMVDPVALEIPIPIRGRQGLYDWDGDIEALQEALREDHPARPEDIRGNLSVV